MHHKIVSDQTKPRQRDDRFGYKKGTRRIASPNLSTKVNKTIENQFQNTTGWPVSTDPQMSKQPSQQPGLVESPKYDSRYPGLLLQPDSRPISQEQLASEVKSIYAGLIMVETKCIEVDKTLANARKENSGQVLTSEHWQALIALHRTLLHEHHDFFLASQHPSASPALRRLAAKYGMPGRMWRIGIHPFLEELRLRLPVDDQDPQDTRDHMIAFIYLCYQMVALLYETVPAFEYTWIECLGDLGRYRMAIDKDIREYEAWANVSRSWYSKAADKTPTVGRLSHHLATLARSSSLQQLYYYSKSLVAVEPFEGSRQSITGTLNTACGRAPVPTYVHAAPVDESFIRAHASLFERNEKENHESIQFEFTEQLDNHIGRMTGAWKDHGVYIAVTNITAWFGYGIGLNILREAFLTRLSQMSSQEHTSTQQPSTSAAEHQKYPPPTINKQDVTSGLSVLASDLIFSKARSLTYDTLALVLRRIGDKHVLPHVHVMLSFFSSIASGENVAHLIDHAPWVELTTFLNTLIKTETQQNRINNIDVVLSKPIFPTGGKNNRGDELPLPEDYMIRGLIWAPVYFTANWFEEEIDEEEKYLEPASTTRTRTERILRLGLRLSSVSALDSFVPSISNPCTVQPLDSI
jgi:hypothetical protein